MLITYHLLLKVNQFSSLSFSTCERLPSRSITLLSRNLKTNIVIRGVKEIEKVVSAVGKKGVSDIPPVTAPSSSLRTPSPGKETPTTGSSLPTFKNTSYSSYTVDQPKIIPLTDSKSQVNSIADKLEHSISTQQTSSNAQNYPHPDERLKEAAPGWKRKSRNLNSTEERQSVDVSKSVYNPSSQNTGPLPSAVPDTTKLLFTDEILQDQEKKSKPIKALSENELNAKSQNSPELFKSVKTQIVYTPDINDSTLPENLSTEQVIKYLHERGLLVINDKQNFIEILIQPEGSFSLGVRINTYKITKHGNAYHNKIIVKRHEKCDDFSHKDINSNTPTDIIMHKPISTGAVVQTGALTHMLYAYLKGDYFYVSGSLTSTKSEGLTDVSNVQYQDYANQKENCMQDQDIKIVDPKRFQLFRPNIQFHKIHKDNVFVAKWGRQYIDFLTDKDYINIVLATLLKRPCIPFNRTGITKEEGLVMCLDYDYTVAKQQKHPSIFEQIIPKDKKDKDKQNAQPNETKLDDNIS